jgi:hypothetical protein
MRSHFTYLLLVGSLLLISGCGLAAENSVTETVAVAIEATEVWTATPTALPSPTATPTLLPSPTVTNTPTSVASPTPDPSCPEPGTAVPFVYPPDSSKLEASILAFLNAGGQWDNLLTLLDELEIKNDLVQADMNGDGVMETAVYTRIYGDSAPEHTWWIFQCISSQYQSIYNTGGAWGFHRFFIADDLDNDHHSEIIAVSGFAGSACALEPMVWSWRSGGLVSLSPDYRELELGCSIDERLLLQDIVGDNIKELILIGETVGHREYAPLRGITQTFKLENSGYVLASTRFAPAELLVHLLDDAQRALDTSNLPLAISYYAQAAYETMATVASYNFYDGEEDHPHAYQQAFALFRLAVVQFATGDREAADLVLTDLKLRYADDQPGYEFVVLTQTFFDAYDQKPILAEACKQVTEYIARHYDRRTELPTLTSHFYWGANIAYYRTPDTFCPNLTVPGHNDEASTNNQKSVTGN